MKRFVWCSILCAVPLVAYSQVYRWVDEQGKVHYGDRPIAKEVKYVPVLREAKPVDKLPTPGMKAEEVKKTYGEPDRAQTTVTKTGELSIWVYLRSKTVTRPFVLKIEGGEVTEVSVDSSLDRLAAPSGSPATASAKAAGAVAAAEQANTQAYDAEAKQRRCTQLKERLQQTESAERRGGSGAAMDRLRGDKQRMADQMASEGCSYF